MEQDPGGHVSQVAKLNCVKLFTFMPTERIAPSRAVPISQTTRLYRPKISMHCTETRTDYQIKYAAGSKVPESKKGE